MVDFDAAYARLNDAQKAAVDTVDGPVMVAAGPGTGKTQVLALRVANILKKTQMRPSNILCLTFSVSGATAMRDRLRALIGSDAYAVTVSTIHGFCQSIINQNPSVFAEWSQLQQISEISKYRELNAIIDAVSKDSVLLNQKDPYARDSDILSRISQVKREGKTTDDLYAVASTYDKAMAAKSKPGTKVHEKNILAARKFRDFVAIFEAYQAMLKEKGFYDYDDMILFVIKALAEEDWVLANLQERFQYILVDEAQDTNGAQWEVIERLTTNPAIPHDPNLFIVGDDDQAIYRFQGANLTNMLAFHRRFPKAPVIALTKSYRSTQRILDAAEALIARNEERLVGKIPGLEKHLVAAKKDEGEAPRLVRAPSDVAEPWLVADLVQARMEAGTPAKEIAVLTQTNAELFGLYDVFKSRGIPVVLHGKSELLQQPVIADTLAVLRALASPEKDAVMLTAMATQPLGCHPADIARLSFLLREEGKRLHHVLIELERLDVPFLRKEALIAARNTLLSLVNIASVRTVLETVEQALRLAANDDRLKDPLALAAMESFFHFTKERCLANAHLTFRGFLNDLEFYADPEYGQARLTFSLPHLVTEGVQLMTAHQSKGLEFETVILANFRDGHWDSRRRLTGISVPEDLLFGWNSDQKKFEQGQDERRVAFVAMTRAKNELIFSCPLEVSVGEKHKPVSPSAFFAEAGELPEQHGALAEPALASLLLHQPVRELDEELKAYLRQRLETFALSATSLSRFLRNPQEFLSIDLLGQPEQLSEGSMRALGYGNAVHWALREWGTAQKKGEQFTEEQFLEAFAWHLQNKNILTDVQRGDLLVLGANALRAYFAGRLSEKALLYAVERDYRAHLGDIPIKGKIDRIDQLSPNSGDVLVIDYKTGTPKTERDIRGGLEPGAVSRTEEGEKFRQLVFYALLLEKADPLITPVAFAMDFVGERTEESSFVELKVTDPEKVALRALITEVWKKIQVLDFTPLSANPQMSPALQRAIKEQKNRSKKISARRAP